MSEPIMRKLEEMKELTYPRIIPPGESIARYSDRLLVEARLELSKCITALKAVVEEHYPILAAPGLLVLPAGMNLQILGEQKPTTQGERNDRTH